jgi:hypothetical protein
MLGICAEFVPPKLSSEMTPVFFCDCEEAAERGKTLPAAEAPIHVSKDRRRIVKSFPRVF